VNIYNPFLKQNTDLNTLWSGMLGVFQKDDYDLPLSINDAQKITL